MVGLLVRPSWNWTVVFLVIEIQRMSEQVDGDGIIWLPHVVSRSCLLVYTAGLKGHSYLIVA